MKSLLPLVYDLSMEDWCHLIDDMGYPAFHGRQIWKGMYQNLWDNPEKYTNIPKELRLKLSQTLSFKSLSPEISLFSKDRQTKKVLFSLPDEKKIETVLMSYERRNTLCISTQVGCPVNCSFCATGQMGFQRNLTAGEMIEQVLFFARDLKLGQQKVTNLVFMGMGEPFLNYDEVMKAIAILNHADGFNFGERRMTISTSGIIPGIERFTKEKNQVNLAVSLHSADDTIRSKLMPINQKYPLNDLMTVCREYTNQTRRRITFEWALIEGLNDSPDAALQLISRIKGMLCHVNLIRLNPTSSFFGNAASSDQARRFQAILEEHNIPCTIRLRRGIDIQAGCGQLASRRPSEP